MKFKSLFVTLTFGLCVTLGAAAAALADDNPFIIKYPFKSLIVKYKMTGDQSGSETLYIKGDASARHINTTAKVFGMTQTTRGIEIATPDKVIHVDLAEGEAHATGNPMTYMAQEYEKLSSAEKARVKENSKKMGTQFGQAMMGGGEPQVSEGTFLGKPVTITKMGSMTSYVWKDTNVLLKSQGSIMGMSHNSEAVSVKEGASVPDDKLRVPDGIEVVFDKEADNMQRQMAKKMMDSLKDPDFDKKGMGNAFMPQLGGDPDMDKEDMDQGAGQDDSSSGLPFDVDSLKKKLGF
jgi:hypothetical protein